MAELRRAKRLFAAGFRKRAQPAHLIAELVFGALAAGAKRQKTGDRIFFQHAKRKMRRGIFGARQRKKAAGCAVEQFRHGITS